MKAEGGRKDYKALFSSFIPHPSSFYLITARMKAEGGRKDYKALFSSFIPAHFLHPSGQHAISTKLASDLQFAAVALI
jgi:hypothetical protein